MRPSLSLAFLLRLAAAVPVVVCFLPALAGCRAGGFSVGTSRAVSNLAELKANVGRPVLLTGRYHDPGKGSRGLDCGFVFLPFADYSLLEQKDGLLRLPPHVEEDAVIEVRAVVRYHPGTRTPLSQARMIQRTGGRVEIIDGREYLVDDPSFAIERATIVRRLD